MSSPVFRVWWDDTAQVARCDWHPGTAVALEHAEAVIAGLRALGRGKVPLLVDIRNVRTSDRAAREYFAKDQGDACAVAILAGSAVTRMMANFFLGVQTMAVPMRMFLDDDEAVAWLHTAT